VVHDRYKLNTGNQLTKVTLDTFYAELKSLTAKYKFNYRRSNADETTPLDEILRNRIALVDMG